MKYSVVAVLLTCLTGTGVAVPAGYNGRDIDALQAAIKGQIDMSDMDAKAIEKVFEKFMGSLAKRDLLPTETLLSAVGTTTPTPVSTPTPTPALGSILSTATPLAALETATGTAAGLTNNKGGSPVNAVTGAFDSVTGGAGGSPVEVATGALGGLAGTASPVLGLITGLIIPLLQGLLQGLGGLGGLGKRDNMGQFGREDLLNIGVSHEHINLIETAMKVTRDTTPPKFESDSLSAYGIPKDQAAKLMKAGPEKIFAAVMALTKKDRDGNLMFDNDKLKKAGYTDAQIKELSKLKPVDALKDVVALSDEHGKGQLTGALQKVSPVTEGLVGTDGGKGDTLSQVGNLAGGAGDSVTEGLGGGLSQALNGLAGSLKQGFDNGRGTGPGIMDAPASAQLKHGSVALLLGGIAGGVPAKRSTKAEPSDKMIEAFTTIQKEALSLGQTFATYLKKDDDGNFVFDEKKIDPNGEEVKQYFNPGQDAVMTRLVSDILAVTGDRGKRDTPVPTPDTPVLTPDTPVLTPDTPVLTPNPNPLVYDVGSDETLNGDPTSLIQQSFSGAVGGLLNTVVSILKGSNDVDPKILDAALKGDVDTLTAYGNKPMGGLVGVLQGLL